MSATIGTKRLDLRLLTKDDAEDIFAYASDPEVAKNTSWFAHTRLEDSQQYVTFVVDAHCSEEGALRHVWAIRRIGEETVIGTIDLVQDSESKGHVDFALARPYWNQGVITESAHGVLKWGFDRLPRLQEVRSGGLTRNVGTMRVLEKLGFELRDRVKLTGSPKFQEEGLEVSRLVLKRNTFYEMEGR